MAKTDDAHYVIRGGERYAGRHLLVDMRGARRLDDEAHVARALRAACAAAGATVLKLDLHRFPGGGVSGVAILAESHMSVHTWPETGFAAIDVFLCGDTDPEAAVPALAAAFSPEDVSVSAHKRGAAAAAGRFHEEMHADYGQFMEMERVVHRERTAHQDLLIFDTRRFGRVLVLDGIVQTTEADNHAYHEMLTHAPILAHGRARRVLIIGGGDGGCLREALRHEEVSATLVDLDAAAVRAARRFMPALSDGAFDDPRATTVAADGAAWLKRAGEPFDVIIVDSTDPIGPGAALFSAEFYAACRDRLAEGGVLVAQAGVPFVQPGVLRAASRRLARAFADTAFYTVAVPTYTGGLMALGWGSDDPRPRRAARETIAARFAASGLKTRYYSPDVHAASFALPPYIRELAG